MKRSLPALLIFLCMPAGAAQPPQRVVIELEVHSGSMHIGVGHDLLEHDGKQYSVVSESKTVGLAAILYNLNIRRESRGLVTGNGLRPLHFQEENSRKPKCVADFDWDARKLTLTEGESVSTVDLPDNSYDQTSFSYAFAFRPPDGELPPVHLTDGRRLADYKYKMLGKEKIKTSMGELETVHFQKIREGDDKRGFDVWLATGHHYLPVQVRFVEKNGTVLDSTVTSISYQ